MFGVIFRGRKSGRGGTLHIAGSDRTAPIAAGETLLGAAVREKIPFPHMCNAGKCGACKCRLVSGHIRLTSDISRHVSPEELSSGFVLACQSVAESEHVEVEVPRPTRPRRRREGGLSSAGEKENPSCIKVF